jgi:hypothetical protein
MDGWLSFIHPTVNLILIILLYARKYSFKIEKEKYKQEVE